MSDIDDDNGSSNGGDGGRKPVAGAKPAVSIAKRQTNRRKVLRTILLTGGVIGAAVSGFLPLIYAQKKRLRPPGALDEKDLLSSCIKCGQCVQVCPVQAMHSFFSCSRPLTSWMTRRAGPLSSKTALRSLPVAFLQGSPRFAAGCLKMTL